MDLGQCIREVEQDIEQKTSKSRNTAVSVSHVESSRSKNKSVLRIEADLRELFPELVDDSQYNEISCQEFKIVVEPDTEFVNYTDSELENC